MTRSAVSFMWLLLLVACALVSGEPLLAAPPADLALVPATAATATAC